MPTKKVTPARSDSKKAQIGCLPYTATRSGTSPIHTSHSILWFGKASASRKPDKKDEPTQQDREKILFLMLLDLIVQ
jgi:hypothetical protein